MAKVTVEDAARDQRDTIDNLFQLYTHDFSEFWSGRPDGELEEDGRFGRYQYLDDYWAEPRREPLLIRADGRLAGFALVNDFAHSGLATDYSMAEFFITRKHRRAGVGFAAAVAVIGARSGPWEIAVIRRNVGAQAFWRRVAAAATAGEIEALDRDDDLWNGLILRFRSR